MTFDDAGSEADQEFQLSHDYTGDIEYATKWVNLVHFGDV